MIKIARNEEMHNARLDRSQYYTLWTSNCFHQTMVVRLLLGLYGVPYCFSVWRADKKRRRCKLMPGWLPAGSAFPAAIASTTMPWLDALFLPA